MASGEKKSLGLYIHVPFCRRKCLYCDFCSTAEPCAELVNAYVDSLLRCISMHSESAARHTVDTVYIGGGTPTTLSAAQLERIIDGCVSNYSFAQNVEISCECNPATGSAEYFCELRSIGINRMSIGLQSTNDNELKALGRIHDFEGFLKTYSDVRNAGFDNVSADLMYGIPLQTLDSFRQSLKTLTALAPEHISAYCLKVEEGTPFGKMGDKLILPDEDTQCEMYELLSSFLSSAGYEKYEISNFAKKGRESRHNLRYWLGEDYLGFGAAAHSYFDGERFAYSPNIADFANGVFTLSEREKIDNEERNCEYVMLRMRLVRGVVFSEFTKEFGKDFLCEFPTVRDYAQKGYIELSENGCRFSEKGFLVSNTILSEMLDF